MFPVLSSSGSETPGGLCCVRDVRAAFGEQGRFPPSARFLELGYQVT